MLEGAGKLGAGTQRHDAEPGAGSSHNPMLHPYSCTARGGYVCSSDIFYGRPKRAVNTYGQWKVREGGSFSQSIVPSYQCHYYYLFSCIY